MGFQGSGASGSVILGWYRDLSLYLGVHLKLGICPCLVCFLGETPALAPVSGPSDSQGRA